MIALTSPPPHTNTINSFKRFHVIKRALLLTLGLVGLEISAFGKPSLCVEPTPRMFGKAPDTGDQHRWLLLESYPQTRLITGDRLLLDNPLDDASVSSPRAFVERKAG